MINRVIIEGFVADEPYVRATESGKLARLRVATIEQLKVSKSNTMRQHTEWHTVTLWGELAEYIDKEVEIGMPIYVEGALRSREWLTKDGTLRNITEISASRVVILDADSPQMVGYSLPKQISERMSARQRTKHIPVTPMDEVRAPADDPDLLPF